jgi:hypothetical protein
LSVRPPQLAKHPSEITDLNQSRPQREIDANADKQIDEDVGVEDLAERVDQLFLKEVHIHFPPKHGPLIDSKIVWAGC